MNRPLRSNGTIHNGKKAEWPVEQAEGRVTQPAIRVYCLLSSLLSLEPARLKPPVKPKEIFSTATQFPYRCVSFHSTSEAKKRKFPDHSAVNVPAAERREPRMSPCSQMMAHSCSTFASSAHSSRQNLLTLHRNYRQGDTTISSISAFVSWFENKSVSSLVICK